MNKMLGKDGKKYGKAPAIVLSNPKYSRNVGAVIRAASCFGVDQVWFTGNRVQLEDGHRLPREERMRGYSKVEMFQYDYPFEQFPDAIPVAIELVPGSEMLPQFEHPDNAIYVFGPEDGHLPQVSMRHCHRFVSIPTYHCTNLAAAVYLVLYDRLVKRQASVKERILSAVDMLQEDRVWTKFGEEDELG